MEGYDRWADGVSSSEASAVKSDRVPTLMDGD